MFNDYIFVSITTTKKCNFDSKRPEVFKTAILFFETKLICKNCLENYEFQTEKLLIMHFCLNCELFPLVLVVVVGVCGDGGSGGGGGVGGDDNGGVGGNDNGGGGDGINGGGGSSGGVGGGGDSCCKGGSGDCCAKRS